MKEVQALHGHLHEPVNAGRVESKSSVPSFDSGTNWVREQGADRDRVRAIELCKGHGSYGLMPIR